MTDDYCPGDAKATRDFANYPRSWSVIDCVTAYWEAVRQHAEPHTTASWEALLAQAQRRASRREPRRGQPDDDEIGF